MIREVLTYPNLILKKVSKKVERFDGELHELLDDMCDTMLAENGVGLAAIQIGVARNVLIILIPRSDDDLQYREDLLEVINPKIIAKSGTEVYREGCLSIPEYYDEVERAAEVEITFQDRNGQLKNLKADGLLAIAIQHEMDHLGGHLFVERLPMLKRKKFEKEWKKRARENKRF